MGKIHIGRKIRQVLDKSPLSVSEFAKKINLTRDGAYKIFDKEAISTDQLQKISNVLNHDFFSYYQAANPVNENIPTYGYATREDLEILTRLVSNLAREMEKMQKDLSKMSGSKSNPKRKKLK